MSETTQPNTQEPTQQPADVQESKIHDAQTSQQPSVQESKARTPPRAIEMASLTTVAPGGTGQIAIKMSGSADLLAVEVESGAVPVKLLASKLQVQFEDEKKSPNEVLAHAIKENGPVRISGYVTLVVKNTTAEPKTFKAALLIENEEAAPAATTATPRPPQPNKTPAPQSAFLHQSGSKRANASRIPPTPKIQHKMPTSRQSNTKHKTTSVQNSVVHTTRHATKEFLEMVLPKEGEHAVLLLKGHVFELVRFLTSRVPLHPTCVPSVLSQLRSGSQREGAVSIGGNEVAALLTSDQIVKLSAVVGRRFNHLPIEDTKSLVDALNAAFTNGVPTQPAEQEKLLTTSAAE